MGTTTCTRPNVLQVETLEENAADLEETMELLTLEKEVRA